MSVPGRNGPTVGCGELLARKRVPHDHEPGGITMKLTRPAGRHVDARAALDYLESRMDAAGRRDVEDHLGRPCCTCRELVRELGWLVDRMRLDRALEVPEALRAP